MAQPSDLHPKHLQATELRQRYPQFVYQASTWKLVGRDVVLQFSYASGESIEFSHSVTFRDVNPERVAHLPTSLLDRLSFALGMITAFSYWKTTASPTILVQAGALSPEEITWWHELLLEGMGEFFFVNNLDFTEEGFVEIVSQVTPGAASEASLAAPALDLTKHFLIPVGGGKDSAVSLEIMKEYATKHSSSKSATSSQTSVGASIAINHSTSSFADQLGTLLFQAPEAAHAMARTSGIPHAVVIYRTFDTKLAELNQLGYLNGHTPFSAMLAFASVMAAVLHGYQSIVLSNEASANEGNVQFHNREINHQYSKTLAFETAFQSYLSQHLFAEYAPGERPSYFSLLRPVSELQIGSKFAQLTQYHTDFRSCNRGQRTNSWCGECSKCLFAYLMLFPFLPWGEATRVFGQELFAKLDLLAEARELLGKGEKKPLECVGTPEECIVAAYLSKKRFEEQGEALPVLLEWISEEVLGKEVELEERANLLMHSWNQEHRVPWKLAEVVKLLSY